MRDSLVIVGEFYQRVGNGEWRIVFVDERPRFFLNLKLILFRGAMSQAVSPHGDEY